MAVESTLTPEEQRFFDTGELQPGMTPEPPTPEPVPPLTATPTPPVVSPVVVPPEPDLHQQQIQNEAADILRQSLAEAQQRVGALEANIQQLQQAQREPLAQAPDKDTDPLGFMTHQLETINKQVADFQAALVQQQTQQTQLGQFQQFQQQVSLLRDQFAKATPDFPDAYTHIRNARTSDLRAFGLTDDKIQQAMFQEEAILAQNAIRQGKNPAEVIYDMAKRHGYVAKAAATPAAPDAKLAAVQQAQNASKTLPSTPVLEDITVDGLKGASDDDLNKLIADEKMWAKIVGADKYPI